MVVKYTITNNSLNNNLFFFRFDFEESKLKHKIISDTVYLTVKQKRYKRRKHIPPYKNTFDCGIHKRGAKIHHEVIGIDVSLRERMSRDHFRKENNPITRTVIFKFKNFEIKEIPRLFDYKINFANPTTG